MLLVHGLNDTNLVFQKMSAYLAALGWSVYDLNLIPCNGNLSLECLAQQVADCIAATFAPEQPIDLIGFSMGGVVSRYYVQRLGGLDRVHRFITVAAPNHGTLTAYASYRPGCMQMRPDSLFLQDLNRDATRLEQLNFTSIWTPFDLMIIPASSSQMPVGRDVKLDILTHPWMLTDPRSLEAVVAALQEPLRQNRPLVHSGDRQKSPQPDSKT